MRRIETAIRADLEEEFEGLEKNQEDIEQEVEEKMREVRSEDEENKGFCCPVQHKWSKLISIV